MFKDIDEILVLMKGYKYVADRSLATMIYLAQGLQKPLLLEGEAGVGKTEVAKVISQILNSKLIRLQCYEGLDVSTSLYEWNYPKQMLEIKMQEVKGEAKKDIEETIFSEKFLLKRPLLQAIQNNSMIPPTLLIDEIDRSDEEFEAFLLEVLSDFQITIPEIGTIAAEKYPFVVITSNRTRQLHDALKRRCLYHWVDYPSFEKELEIVLTKIPGIRDSIARQVCEFMQKIRQTDFHKNPGIAETLDWAQALIVLGKEELDQETIDQTLGCILKYKDDMLKFREMMLLGLC
ncbi:ATPase [uncultured Desulfobacterium sp.]|uniref:ATPase n=1 Tax=uncultured Desulfobacterium sp. TaxID=201089 RepID=A0A445MX57_9BACT|nr:ATPase [uncultured Desulfobacterium sp.]